MIKSIPLVSIIIPVYNRAHLLNETLKCVEEQNYTNWECLIIDDGSQDGTFLTIEKFCKKDPRFKFFERPNSRQKGASSCRNIGLENSTGSYVQFLDSDDLMSRDKIKNQLEIMECNSQISFATCKWSRFEHTILDAKDFENLKSYNNFNDLLTFLNALSSSFGYFPIHAYLFRKETIDRAGYWNENLSLNDDTEFLSRIFVISNKIIFINGAIAYYRKSRQDNISLFSSQLKADSAIRSWKMIEILFQIRFKEDNIKFIETAKELIYLKTRKYFPDLLEKNSDFFKDQIKRDLERRSLRFLIKRKISKIYSTYFKS